MSSSSHIDFSSLSMGEDDEEVILGSSNPGSADDQEFDTIVGCLEDLLISEEFSDVQSAFCREYCGVFEAGEESKLVYTDVFEQYTELIEGHIQGYLSEVHPGFEMAKFGAMLADRGDEITGDVFDMLMR